MNKNGKIVPVRESGINRLPPHSIEAEQGVLGCCLLDAKAAMPIAQTQISSDEAFYDLRHRIIWNQLVRMIDNFTPIDSITLHQTLKDAGELDQIGGDAYLSALADCVPSAANVDYYIQILIEKWQLRRMVRACTETVSRIYDGDGDSDALIDAGEREILAARTVRLLSGHVQPIKELVHVAMDQIENLLRRQGAIGGIATGYPDLDKMTDGLQLGEFTVIAAFPSVGKTSLAMNIAEHVAVDLKLPVGIFSVEMSGKSLVTRLLCSRARVNMRNVRDGFLADRDFPKITGAAGKLASSMMHFVDQSDLSINQLRAIGRRMHRNYQIKLFIVDYLQLLNASGRKIENKTQETAAISNGLKNMAKELDAHVIACSQLTKDRDGSVKCRNAAEIHQDADNLFVLMPADEPDENNSEAMPITLEIRKQRNGPQGIVNLIFLKPYTRFESAAKVYLEDGSEQRLPYRD